VCICSGEAATKKIEFSQDSMDDGDLLWKDDRFLASGPIASRKTQLSTMS
jgi:hypothetical protein